MVVGAGTVRGIPPLTPLVPRAAGPVDPAVVKAGAEDPFTNFSQNLQRDLEYADLCMQRGYAWGVAKEYDKAIPDFNEAIRFNPQLAGAYIGRGHAHCGKKAFDKAIADYDQALKIDPAAVVALMGRGPGPGSDGADRPVVRRPRPGHQARRPVPDRLCRPRVRVAAEEGLR